MPKREDFKATPEFLLKDAGIDEISLVELRKGISGSERLFRVLTRAGQNRLAKKARLSTINEEDLLAALDKKGKHETLIQRIKAGEFQ
tara:strand:- start:1356 stop:1619 length:264 start_codon:yes stop_codon:yes gene_type:complete